MKAFGLGALYSVLCTEQLGYKGPSTKYEGQKANLSKISQSFSNNGKDATAM